MSKLYLLCKIFTTWIAYALFYYITNELITIWSISNINLICNESFIYYIVGASITSLLYIFFIKVENGSPVFDLNEVHVVASSYDDKFTYDSEREQRTIYLKDVKNDINSHNRL